MHTQYEKNFSVNGNQVLWVAQRMMNREEFRVWVDTWCQPDYSHGYAVRQRQIGAGLAFKDNEVAERFFGALKPHEQA